MDSTDWAPHVDELHLKALLANSTISNDWSQFPGLPFSFRFESSFARNHHRQWMYHHWYISVAISTIYVILVLLGKWFMSRRSHGYNLRTPLAIWSSILAIFSIVGTIRCLPEFIHVIYSDGLYASYCKSSYFYDVRLTFWYWIFTWSKVAELGDTAFIVLRKQRLITLHWVHHVLTLSYAFFVLGDVPGTARWMVNMNFMIHSVMYTYYALKAMKFEIPRFVAMFITLSQITQMCFGLYINFYAYQFKTTGVLPCDLSLSTAAAGLFLYSIFFVLFIKFFFSAYNIWYKLDIIIKFIKDFLFPHSKEEASLEKKLD